MKRVWYIAHEILYFPPKPIRGIKRPVTVWENLRLYKAVSPEQAFKKAMAQGRLNNQPVRIDGKSGYCKFLGLRELTQIYDPLGDGAELEWRTMTVKQNELRGLVIAKKKMQAFKSHGPTVTARKVPKIIPPRSMFRLARSDVKTPTWKKDVERVFRIGYYSRQDGLDDIWLVNEKGEYEGTADRDHLLKYFEPVKISRETNLYGVGKPQFRPLRRVRRRRAK